MLWIRIDYFQELHTMFLAMEHYHELSNWSVNKKDIYGGKPRWHLKWEISIYKSRSYTGSQKDITVAANAKTDIKRQGKKYGNLQGREQTNKLLK